MQGFIKQVDESYPANSGTQRLNSHNLCLKLLYFKIQIINATLKSPPSWVEEAYL